MKKLLLLCLSSCLSSSLTLLSESPHRSYIESVDSFTLGHGRFVVGHYSIASHMPGQVVFLKTIRASKNGLYYLQKDIVDIKDVSYLYNALPSRPDGMHDTEWREIYSQVFDLPNVEEVDEEEIKK